MTRRSMRGRAGAVGCAGLAAGCVAVWWLCGPEWGSVVLWPAFMAALWLWPVRGQVVDLPAPGGEPPLFDLRQVDVVTDEPVTGDPDGLEALWALPPAAEPTYRQRGGRP